MLHPQQKLFYLQ